jgi:serine/threonine protein kinase
VHPGQRIGKYVLGERIAVGGMAEVWAARAEGPEGFVKPVALKFILESFSGDPELEKLFVKEARIAAQLQHANLVAVFDFDKVVVDPERGHGGRYYIAMEHVEGHDARRVAEAAKHAGYAFTVPLALYLGGEVLKGLRYVHERREKGRLLGLVHRDVSPHNVLVGFSGEVKLSDFGIAKSLAHSGRTRTGTVRGKLSYASPEQLSGESVDHRADQFAMGISLWEILAGRPLFDGNDEVEIVGKVIRCDIPSLGLVCPERKIPAAVEGFVRRMLEPRRADRFSTTADALSALLALPGYTGDGVGLGDLVRTLFHRASVGPASTMNLPGSLVASSAPLFGPASSAAAAAPARRPAGGRGPAPRGDGARAGAARDVDPLPPSEIETRTMARAAVGRSPTGGRNVTTAPVRGSLGRSRSAIAAVAVAAVAGVVLLAIVVGGAVSVRNRRDPAIAVGATGEAPAVLAPPVAAAPEPAARAPAADPRGAAPEPMRAPTAAQEPSSSAVSSALSSAHPPPPPPSRASSSSNPPVTGPAGSRAQALVAAARAPESPPVPPEDSRVVPSPSPSHSPSSSPSAKPTGAPANGAPIVE